MLFTERIVSVAASAAGAAAVVMLVPSFSPSLGERLGADGEGFILHRPPPYPHPRGERETAANVPSGLLALTTACRRAPCASASRCSSRHSPSRRRRAAA